MKHSILGRKLGMSQVFDQQGNAIPVTVIQAGPCRVLQVKTTETDGYNAVQLGFVDKKEKNTTRPLQGHFKKAGSTPQRFVREVRVDDPALFSVGQVVTCGCFAKGDFVDITGTSKGKGYAGVMKRHGFSGFEMTHGTHESKRGPGSIGQASDPSRTFPGMRMAGRMGGETVTVQNLVVIDNRESQNLIFVKGPVPGGKNELLTIRHSVKKAAPPERKAEPEAAPAPEEPAPTQEAAPEAAPAPEESAPKQEAEPVAAAPAEAPAETDAAGEEKQAQDQAGESSDAPAGEEKAWSGPPPAPCKDRISGVE